MRLFLYLAGMSCGGILIICLVFILGFIVSWLLPADNIGKLPYYKNVPPTPRKKSCVEDDAWHKYKGMYQPNVDNTTRPPTKDFPKDENVKESMCK